MKYSGEILSVLQNFWKINQLEIVSVDGRGRRDESETKHFSYRHEMIKPGLVKWKEEVIEVQTTF